MERRSSCGCASPTARLPTGAVSCASTPSNPSRRLVSWLRTSPMMHHHSPALAQMQRSSTPRVIAKRAQFTEYVVICAVSANSAWELIAEELPHGVAIRDERGSWSNAGNAGAAVARGRSAHFIEVLLLVRVWREAEADWESHMVLRVKPVEG